MKNLFRKIFTLLLSVLLIFPSLLQASLTYDYTQTFIDPCISKISQSYINNNENIIVFIQDMHSNPEVQKNIYETISFFDKQYGVDKILMEGVPYSKTDTSFITSLQNYNPKVSEYLLNKGMLTGTEYFLIKDNPSTPIYGLENWDIYINNIKLLANIKFNFNGANKIFSEFYKIVIERTNAKKILKYIDFDITNKKLLKKVNQPILKYDTLNKYIALSETKKSFDNKTIKKEYINFLNVLKNSLDFTSYKNIIDKVKNEDISDYWQTLYEYFLQNKNYQSEYKKLFSYLEYLSQINSLNIVSLIYQQNEYFNDFLNYLYINKQNIEEKIFIIKMTNLFEKIISLSISEYEYDFFINNFERYKQLLEIYLTNEDLIKFNTIIESNKILEYYKVNKQRNDIFINNILSSVSLKNDTVHKNKPVTIVVAGGFHSSILKNLKEKNLQYLLITPYSKTNKITDAYSKIVSSTYEQQMLAQIPAMLANSTLVPEHTRDLFLAELIEAFAAVYDESPIVIEEHIRKLVRNKWAEPLNIHIKDDNFNIYIGNQVISFKIKNNRIDFTSYKIGPIEESTIFIRDFGKEKTVEYTVSINNKTFIFEIEKDIASNLTEENIQRLSEEIKSRIGENEISFIKKDSNNQNADRIFIKTFEKSNSNDLFIDNISQSNTFFINKKLLKTDKETRDLFLEISIIHTILFSFFDKSVFDKDLLTEEDINFILNNIDKDSFGLPDIDKLKKAIETEFSDKEVRILSQLKKYSGNLELLIQEVLEKDYISEYRLPHWKHIVSQYFSPSKGESKKSIKKRHSLEKKFFSKIIVDNSQEESFQEFLDRRISLQRQQKIKSSIKHIAQHLIDSASTKEKPEVEKISKQLEQNIYDCLELMYRNLPKHAFEKFINEKGVVSDHNFNHSIKLIENAVDIIKTEEKSFKDIDFTIVVYAALMHDLSCIFFRDNHERNSAILAGEILKNSSLSEKMQRRIVAACLGHEKVGDRGERVEHKIYEARLIHDADGLSAVMYLERIVEIWMKSKEIFFAKERTVDERLDLIERDRFLYTEGGDMINDLLRQFVRMKPSRYLTKGAQIILNSAMKNGEEKLISLINEYKVKIFETYGINEETFQQAIETIRIMFKNPKFNKILEKESPRKEEVHDDIFDFSRDIDTENTLLIDIATKKEELYKIEKAERSGLNTLTISFSDDNILSDIPLTNVINLNELDENEEPIQEIEINGHIYLININLNFIKINSYYSEYMKVITIEAPNLPEELKPEIIKYVNKQIINNKKYSEYIKSLENITVINFDQANTDYELLTKTKKLSKDLAKILTQTWGEIPVLYDLRTEKGLIVDSNDFKIENINAILSAA